MGKKVYAKGENTGDACKKEGFPEMVATWLLYLIPCIGGTSTGAALDAHDHSVLRRPVWILVLIHIYGVLQLLITAGTRRDRSNFDQDVPLRVIEICFARLRI
jgi:hypothetical protein